MVSLVVTQRDEIITEDTEYENLTIGIGGTVVVTNAIITVTGQYIQEDDGHIEVVQSNPGGIAGRSIYGRGGNQSNGGDGAGGGGGGSTAAGFGTGGARGGTAGEDGAVGLR